MTTDPLSELRHSCAHLLAAAVLELYPATKLTIGPAIDDGFYYDFDFADTPVSEHDFPKIEGKMRDLVKSWTEFTHETVSLEAANARLADNPYKLELLAEIGEKGEDVTFYTAGAFTDLCRGGHSKHPSKELKHFKLLSIAGAYWRGSEKNKMLTRIYGTCFATREELDAHLLQLEEAKKRDHRKLGRDLELFAFDDDVGPGLPLWLPNGTVIIEELEKLAKHKEEEAGFQRVRTPHIARESMYLTSGHLPYYQDSMYPPMEYDDTRYYLKAMNCPHHHKVYAARPRSYKELPIRLAEYGTVYRHEDSGSLFGLMRVRMLSMNDAHIYCTQEQFEEEFDQVNKMYLEYFKLFGIEKYVMRLSLHAPSQLGKKYVDEPELWLKTEEMVRSTFKKLNIPFVEVEDEAAFYGPKIDVQVWSAIGREFSLATNQVDFAVPKRFDLTYVDADGQEKTPLCIHRAPLGTHERFIGFLIEHYAGAFPTWLAPVQVKVLPVSEKHNERAAAIVAKLKAQGVRAELDDDNKTLGAKIRGATLQKIPFMGIIGDKECESDELILSIRSREGQDYGQQSVDIFLKNTFHTPISL